MENKNWRKERGELRSERQSTHVFLVACIILLYLHPPGIYLYVLFQFQVRIGWIEKLVSGRHLPYFSIWRYLCCLRNLLKSHQKKNFRIRNVRSTDRYTLTHVNDRWRNANTNHIRRSSAVYTYCVLLPDETTQQADVMKRQKTHSSTTVLSSTPPPPPPPPPTTTTKLYINHIWRLKRTTRSLVFAGYMYRFSLHVCFSFHRKIVLNSFWKHSREREIEREWVSERTERKEKRKKRTNHEYHY